MPIYRHSLKKQTRALAMIYGKKKKMPPIVEDQPTTNYGIKLCLQLWKTNPPWEWTPTPDGSIDRYRARLVAKGFHQTHGFDYFETFSPVVKPTNIHVVLSLALNKNWCIRQLDVHDAFLNGDLPEQVFMMQHQVLWILLNPIFL